MVRIERGACHACGKRTAVRDGVAADGRPQYKCLNGSCEDRWTKGHQGETWDTKPAES
jgi:hypothetical protein